MEYNSVRSKLIIPEYGRNVQSLVEYAKTIEDKEHRQAFTEQIVDLVQSMHPQSKNVDDYRAKLWSHVMRIANFELDVDTPEDITLIKESVSSKPKKINYPKLDAKFRHYGRNVQEMIKKAIEMEDADKKEAFTNVIGAYMKMAYKNWNKQSVSDETIKADLEKLSKGELSIDENINLDHVYSSISGGNRRRGHSNKRERYSNNRGRDNRGGRQHRRRK